MTTNLLDVALLGLKRPYVGDSLQISRHLPLARVSESLAAVLTLCPSLSLSFRAHVLQRLLLELSGLDLSDRYYHRRIHCHASELEADVALGGTDTASAADSVPL